MMQGDSVDFGPGWEGEPEDLEWTAVDSLISANQRGMRVLEQYILKRYYLEGHPNYAESESQLDTMIEEHERLIEDLYAARAAIETLE
ncbi:MAG: hypothetical protein ABEI27_10620 [Halobellus sp.]|uniref:hypothetical protein n=1 Tax=Halobellus sp. TaxID=1979212 RepID=UPI0035D413EB